MVPGWERFVRRILDSEAVEVFLSGSSAAPNAAKRLLTLTLDGAPREVPSGVAVQTAYEWLLAR